MIQLPQAPRKVDVLVENKVSFAAEHSELSIYDTYQSAERVGLSSDQLMFCGMVSGKKIMHADAADVHDDFLPHESFILAPNQKVEIDFPDARLDRPTTCLAIEITPERINKIAGQLNSSCELQADFGEWHYQPQLLHSHHTSETQALLNRIVNIYTENHPDRSFLIDLAVSELSVRLLRHQTRDFIVNFSERDPQHNAINASVQHIMKRLNQPIDSNELAAIACMSRTKFFGVFKRHFGCSPTVFQQQERLKLAAKHIASGKQVTETCFELGFMNVCHFSTAFKRFWGLSPKQYQNRKRVN